MTALQVKQFDAAVQTTQLLLPSIYLPDTQDEHWAAFVAQVRQSVAVQSTHVVLPARPFPAAHAVQVAGVLESQVTQLLAGVHAPHVLAAVLSIP